MKLVPNIPDPEKWVKFYQAMANGRLKIRQHGSGGALGPTLHASNYTSVRDTIEPMVVSPTEMITQQAQSAINHQHGTVKQSKPNTRGQSTGNQRGQSSWSRSQRRSQSVRSQVGRGRGARGARNQSTRSHPTHTKTGHAKQRQVRKRGIKTPLKRKAVSQPQSHHTGRTSVKVARRDIFS